MVKKLSDIFKIDRGKSKYTKKYGTTKNGKFPVYSASINKPMTFIDSFDYEGNYLTWTINGFGGYTQIIGGKFSINADRGILIPKTDVYLPYFKYILQPIFRGMAVGRLLSGGKNEYTKLHPYMIKDLKIDFVYDLEKQKEIVSKYEIIEKNKRELVSLKNELLNIEIEKDINVDDEHKEVVLSDIFDFKKGSSKYTKDYIKANSGVYPLYSSQTSDSGIIGFIDTYDFDCECLTWTTDGIHAGTVFLRNGKFSMSTHCGALTLKEKYTLYLPFLCFVLNKTLKKYAMGDLNKRVTVNLIKDVSIKIPVDKDGKFDLEKQKELAKQYEILVEKKKKLEKLKNEVIDKLESAIKKEILITS